MFLLSSFCVPPPGLINLLFGRSGRRSARVVDVEERGCPLVAYPRAAGVLAGEGFGDGYLEAATSRYVDCRLGGGEVVCVAVRSARAVDVGIVACALEGELRSARAVDCHRAARCRQRGMRAARKGDGGVRCRKGF